MFKRVVICCIAMIAAANVSAGSKMHIEGNLTDIYVAEHGSYSQAEQMILCTLSGLAANDEKAVWINYAGQIPEWYLAQYKALGVNIHKADSIWGLLQIFRPIVKGYILYDINKANDNCATSLCGPMRAIAVDVSLAAKMQDFNLPMLADVREMNEPAVFQKYNLLFSDTAMAELITGRTYLRDFITANNLFVFWNPENTVRRTYLKKLKPNSIVYGYGPQERKWVEDLSRSQTAGVPTDFSLNLPLMSRLKVVIPGRPGKNPQPVKEGERIICFVMSDGDNLCWLQGSFVSDGFFWSNPLRGSFNITWELAPKIADIAPGLLLYLYSNASAKDDFVIGSSGLGYCFPNYLPDRKSFAKLTADYAARCRLSIISILDSRGDLSNAKEYLECPNVLGVLYKDYSAYNKFGGEVYWHKGKPCASYKYLLWDNCDQNRPEGIAKSISQMPSSPTKDPNSYALVNVHVWSFRNVGGPMAMIKKIINLLPPNTRVVTAEEYFILLRNNFGLPAKIDK